MTPRFPEQVAVAHLACEHVSHRLDASVRVKRKSRFVVSRFDRTEMIEEQERIDVIEPARGDAAAQVHARALDDRLGHDDGFNGSDNIVHN